MTLPNLLPRECLFKTLRDQHGANMLMKPQPIYESMLVVGRDPENQVSPSIRGLLSSFIDSQAIVNLQNACLAEREIPLSDGLKSKKFLPKAARQILDGYLKGFVGNGGTGPSRYSFHSALRSVSDLAFSFPKVYLQQVNHTALFHALTDTRLNDENPGTRDFLGPLRRDFLLIDGTLLADELFIHFRPRKEHELKHDLIELRNAIQSLGGDVRISRIDNHTLSLKQDIPLPIAITCIQLQFGPSGRFQMIPMVKEDEVRESGVLFKHMSLSKCEKPLDLEECALCWE